MYTADELEIRCALAGSPRADELIARLEGEIAKRDARIMGLESQYQRDVWGLNNEGDPIGGDPAGGYANDNARLRTELAALKAQGVVMPDGWIPLTIEHEPGYPEDVAFGPKRMMDRLKKWLDRYFEMRLKAAPVQQVSVPQCFTKLLHHAHGMTFGADWNKGTMAGYHREPLGEAVVQCQAWLDAALSAGKDSAP